MSTNSDRVTTVFKTCNVLQIFGTIIKIKQHSVNTWRNQECRPLINKKNTKKWSCQIIIILIEFLSNIYVDILKVTSIHVLATITSKHAYLMGHLLIF